MKCVNSPHVVASELRSFHEWTRVIGQADFNIFLRQVVFVIKDFASLIGCVWVPSAKKRQPADSSSMLILILAESSFMVIRKSATWAYLNRRKCS